AEISSEIIQHTFRKCSISNTIDSSEDNEICHDEVFDNRTHQTSDEICCDEICYNEVSSENIIIIDSSEDEDSNTNQDVFVEEDDE
ncbi:20435_t:CDS:1, partial [Racocetra persica]